MKYLENIELEKLSSFLTGTVIGDRILKGRVETFSCKRAGEDKKLSKSLDLKLSEDYGTVGSSSTRASLNSSSFARMCSFLSLLLFVYFFPFFKEMKSRVIFPLSV